MKRRRSILVAGSLLLAFCAIGLAADKRDGGKQDLATGNTGFPSQPPQSYAPGNAPGPAHQLFIGGRGMVLAIDRSSGQELWRSPLKGRDFVNVVLKDGDLYAATHGELFCLDVGTGHVRWHVPLKGLGRGLVTIAGNQQKVVLRSQKKQEDDDAAAVAAVSSTM